MKNKCHTSSCRAADYLAPSKVELEATSRYTSRGHLAVSPHLTMVLSATGMFFPSWFFVYEVTSTNYTRELQRAPHLLGGLALHRLWGPLYRLLWVSIYV